MLHTFLGEISQRICLLVSCSLARWRYYSIQISILIARSDRALCFLAGMRKCIFAQVSFYLQGVLNDINEQDTSLVDCKHKHMMKCGAPPDKFGVHTGSEIHDYRQGLRYRPTDLLSPNIPLSISSKIDLNLQG